MAPLRDDFFRTGVRLGELLGSKRSKISYQPMDITLNTYGHFIPGGGKDEAERLEPRDTGGLRRANNGNGWPRSATNLKAVT